MIYKCKMCGGTLEIAEGVTVCECDYCGTTQTIPATRDEVVSNLFNRANNLRMRSEFDKAQEIYEKIVAQNADEAEAYWGIILCKYGIEYVEDPATLKKIPTCHRTQLESVFTDVDYIAAIEHCDIYQRSVYEEEARAIDALQKNILEIVRKEKPFDVFICYKETDENGKRTPDSVIANDIYHQLAQEGIKTFYAAITLEDKLGQEYEPYIFAALTSAKVMLVVGTRPEYFSAVWVKNEWSRFLKLMKTDRSKLLIPCYRDMDAYDLPEEFSHLQAQDMSKIGFVNDIIRGIKKVTVKAETPQPTVVKETVVQSAPVNTNVAPLLKRAAIFLGDGDWSSANEYCEKVLDIDPENAQAYLYKVLSKLHISEDEMYSQYIEDFLDSSKYIDNDPDYKKAYKFGDSAMKAKLDDFRNSMIYNGAVRAWTESTTDKEYRHAAKGFDIVADYRDSRERSEQCEESAKKYIYKAADYILSHAGTEDDYSKAKESFKKIPGYRDSDDKILLCDEGKKGFLYYKAVSMQDSAVTVEDFNKAADVFRKISGYKDSDDRVAQCKIGEKEYIYNHAMDLMKTAHTDIDFINIAEIFKTISDYKDSNYRIAECENITKQYVYNQALSAMKNANTPKQYIQASLMFADSRIYNYNDSKAKAKQCRDLAQKQKIYDTAMDVSTGTSEEAQNEAAELFESISDFKDSAEKAEECRKKAAEYVAMDKAAKRYKTIGIVIAVFGVLCAVFFVLMVTVIIPSVKYNNGLKAIESGEYVKAIALFEELGDNKDSADQITVAKNSIAYDKAVGLLNAGNYEEAISIFSSLGSFKDSASQLTETRKLKNQRDYDTAVKLLNAGNYEDAISAFTSLNGFSDSAEQLAKATELKNQKDYDTAIELLDTGKYDEAIEAFTSLNGFSDSAEQLTKATELKNQREYDAAIELLTVEKYDEAISAFTSLNGYSDSAEQATKATELKNQRDYDAAVELLKAGKYEEAIEAFNILDWFSDSREQAKKAYISKIKAGAFSSRDIITLGGYSWIVIRKTDNSAQLLAENILWEQPFYNNDEDNDHKNGNFVWENCALRRNLNCDFYNTFSEDEKAIIQEVTLNNDNNSKYTGGGNVTVDNIYLLSVEEAEHLFIDTRKCGTCWWLRSTGEYSDMANAIVSSDGNVDAVGNLQTKKNGVRPAMTIKFDE